MDLNLNKEQIFVNETVFDGQAEQGVEFDYVLPDYHPDIFKILKCSLNPKVTSWSVSGDKLIIDGVVYIKVIYLGENSTGINCIDQRMSFSKTIDLGRDVESSNPQVNITPKLDYCNCRAVSGRRVDIRGAISLKVKVTAAKPSEIIADVAGENVEVKKEPVSYCGKKLSARKQFSTKEDIEVSASGEGVSGIIHFDVVAIVTEFKVIAGKVIIKGEAQIKALYTVKNGEDEVAETMEAALPLSQIVDVEGITENHLTMVDVKVINSDLSVRKNENGDSKIFSAEITCEGVVTGQKENSVEIVSDVYSTDYESKLTKSNIKIETLPKLISQPITQKASVEVVDGELENVFDAWADVVNSSCKCKNDKELLVTAQLNCQVLAKTNEGTPVFIEKQIPVEAVVDAGVEAGGVNSNSAADFTLRITNVSFNVVSANTIDLRIQLNFKCSLYQVRTLEIISDISILEDKPKKKENDYALKLYFAENGEDIWAIAKRYNTSAQAIIAENEVEGKIEGEQTAGGLLLIPIR